MRDSDSTAIAPTRRRYRFTIREDTAMLHVIPVGGQALRVIEASLSEHVLREIASFDTAMDSQHERDLVGAGPGRLVNRVAGIRQSSEPEVSTTQIATSFAASTS